MQKGDNMKLTKEEDKVICKFLKNVSDEGGEGLFRLMQFVLMKLSERAIRINVGEVALSQTLNHEGEKYHTRMAIQYSKVGEKTLEERAYEIADRMLLSGSGNCDLREELKKAILAGYNLYHEDFDTVIQDVFLGPIPYMTDKATFVINGAERVVVSQLHRSPGVFFGQSVHANGTKLYSARIIPFKGSWIEFATDINNVMYAYIDRKKKLPVTTLLRAIGFETDKDILFLSSALYQRPTMKRVYYSGYVSVNTYDTRLPALKQPPLVRENRLYQADWLMRFYQFKVDEIVDDAYPDLDLEIDPKLSWALRHPEQFPVDINKADYEMLLRVPGIGVKSAKLIVASRRFSRLGFYELKKIGVVMKKAQYFITCKELPLQMATVNELSPQRVRSLLLPKPKKKVDERQLLLDFGE